MRSLVARLVVALPILNEAVQVRTYTPLRPGFVTSPYSAEPGRTRASGRHPARSCGRRRRSMMMLRVRHDIQYDEHVTAGRRLTKERAADGRALRIYYGWDG